MMIQYPLGATCFNTKQCKQLQARYLPTFLTKMGINRYTATAIRHGPTFYGGMDNFQLETEQGVLHTTLTVAHLRKDDEVGRMFQFSLEHLQLQSGVSWPVLSKPGHKQRLYVDPCHLTNTWAFLDSVGSHIRLEPEQWIRTQRTGDTFIMESISNLHNIKPIELVHAQRCRLYLGVTTLADISTSNGRRLCEWAINGNQPHRTPTFRFPRQSNPSPTVWNTWKQVLRRCYCTQRDMTLDHPLGLWYRGCITQVWDSVIDPHTSLLYVYSERKVRIYERRGRSQKQYRFLRPHTTASFPLGCVPITIDHQSGYLITLGYATITTPTIAPPEHIIEMRLLNRGVTSNTPEAIVAQAIWDGHAIMGTDGSVKDDIATYSWVISTTNDTIGADVKGGGFLPPTAQYMDHYSKRPEAAALFAGLSWIHALLKRYPDTNPETGPTPSLPIPVDNKAVILDVHRTIDDLTATFHLLHPDYDILQAIRSVIADLPMAVDIFHVKSHQDQQKPIEDLHPHAQINVHADHHADAIYAIPPPSTGLFPSWVPGTRAALFHKQSQITKDLPNYLRAAAHAPAMKKYLVHRSQTATGRDSTWDDATFDTIAWQPLGESFKKLSIGQRIQLSKYMNDLLPTAMRLQTFDNRNDGRCFDCHGLWENTNHVLQCCSPTRLATRTAAFTTFRAHLKTQHTPDILATLLCDNMTTWITRQRPTPPTLHNPDDPILQAITTAFHSQSNIGWDQFFRGRIATDWKTAISTYYHERRPGTAFTPDQWMRTTIDALWTFSMTLWRQRNASLHGEDSILTLEKRRKETATKAASVYQETIGKVRPSDGLILHRTQIADILTWTKQHLDAYLATAEVVCEWNIEPG
jgi:hypothetical protein